MLQTQGFELALVVYLNTNLLLSSASERHGRVLLGCGRNRLDTHANTPRQYASVASRVCARYALSSISNGKILPLKKSTVICDVSQPLTVDMLHAKTGVPATEPRSDASRDREWKLGPPEPSPPCRRQRPFLSSDGQSTYASCVRRAACETDRASAAQFQQFCGHAEVLAAQR
ncbi:uncharacterized protein B0I36DRAFT_18155 [Microdochium trichocladiopsis]|uniref:Uncharacterized protein n=1 Tax=Microdochium trichocladiopsis TaxID=1682393 RepID=A0A9P9BWP8_9PEZI|nr:uncharacterized protein B0I36DRAFT_18155 [Microdochium trichocladiopsis]KAH7041007.1 hypothetical protein B0I36DRAFT_18155 [Microdochium trichocladiopsis]